MPTLCPPGREQTCWLLGCGLCGALLPQRTVGEGKGHAAWGNLPDTLSASWAGRLQQG